MRELSTIDTALGRLLKARSQLTADFKNRVADITQVEYDARMKEINTKIDSLQQERKEAEREVMKKREKNW
jgi:acetolactate synthase small subunit